MDEPLLFHAFITQPSASICDTCYERALFATKISICLKSNDIDYNNIQLVSRLSNETNILEKDVKIQLYEQEGVGSFHHMATIIKSNVKLNPI